MKNLNKAKITGLNTAKLLSFFNESILYGDQVLDINKYRFHCKAGNASLSNIIYREMPYNVEAEVDESFPEHIKFFLQDYKILAEITRSMVGESSINMTFTYENDICKEIVFDNKFISFSILCSEWALSKYIEDARFSAIKNPTDIVCKCPLKKTKISEIKSLHKLSKSDNEKMNLIFMYQKMDKIVLMHESVKGNWKLEMDAEIIEEDTVTYALSLDLFDNLGSNTEFEFKVVKLGERKACYLTSVTGNTYINISGIEKENGNGIIKR